MKSTGIVRQIDELGRIVVPKEIRKDKISKVLSMDYKYLGQKVLRDFKKYIDESNEQALLTLLKG